MIDYMTLKKMKKKKKVSKFIQIFDYKMIFYDIVKFISILPTLLYFRLKTYYINNKKQKGLFRGKSIIVSNHAGYTDPVIISYAFWRRRVSFVATSELFQKKFFGKFLRLVRCISIDKNNVSVRTFKDVKERLDRGHLVSLFPEGQVEREENVQTFKSGVVMMAIMTDSPIIPMYVHKRTKWYKRQVVMIGEKIYLKDYIKSKIPTIEEMDIFAAKLRDIEEQLKKACENKLNRR